jgi:small subunit ribosomal protein S2
MEENKPAQEEPKKEVVTESSQKDLAGFKYEDLELSVPEMLKRGVHFGHRKSRWNPKMKPYTFTVRNNMHIIDLEKTLNLFGEALSFLRGVAQNGGKILLIGTKPQARKLVETAAREIDMPYVSSRWLGGTFTNFSEVKKRIKYLNEQEFKLERGELEKYTKYEQTQFKKEIERMNEKMGGLKKMEGLPQAIVVLDIKEDNLVVKEAKKVKIPVVAIVDTNTDPTLADYPIPGNDDALSSLQYIVGIIVKAVKEEKKAKAAAVKETKPSKI